MEEVIKSLRLANAVASLFIGICFAFVAQPARAKSSSGVNIPVRLGFMAAYNSSTNYFKDNYENNSLSAPGFGIDFSVPFKAINFSVGLAGWIILPGKTGEDSYNGMYLATLYAKYLGDNYDLFIGPGLASMSRSAGKIDAAPNESSSVTSGTMGCGVSGARTFFGKDISAGIGLAGYYCMTGSYTKKVKSTSQIETETKISEKASMYGGLVFLFFEWNEERKLF